MVVYWLDDAFKVNRFGSLADLPDLQEKELDQLPYSESLYGFSLCPVLDRYMLWTGGCDDQMYAINLVWLLDV